ncbi:MAG: PQQ-binding-like beta-propeller repeat protein [Verrucomicrobia bacterium]|nr:PQQ-binding-like beta-propeller repeat protein [Verrucomicrobiota bacterium]
MAFAVMTVAFAHPGTTHGEESGAPGWPGFLGPGGIAVAPASDAGVLAELGKNEQNVLWKVESGSGRSSPCVTGDFLFLTSTEEAGQLLVMTAYDRRDGSIAWQHKVKGEVEKSYAHKAANPAQPTACTDGKRVVFYFGGYGLIVCDVPSGKVIWGKRFPDTSQMFGTGDSPLLFDGGVILVRDGGKDSAIHCFDITDGKLKWKSVRPGLRHTYSSPFLWNNRERKELVVPGTNSLLSYDPKDGRKLWSVDGLCVFPCTTPVGDSERLYFAAWATPNADGVERARQNFWGDIEISEENANDPQWVFKKFDVNGDGKIAEAELPESRGRDAFNFLDANRDGFWDSKEYQVLQNMSAPGKNLMVAVEAGHEGELKEGEGIAWVYSKGKALPYVPSPLIVGGKVYLLKSGGVITCLDAATGKTIYGPKRNGVSGEYYASPVAWGDKVILCAQRGVVLILGSGDEMKVLGENQIGDEIYATPAIVDGVIYFRTDKHLLAIGKKD